jgi:hypothetical protein
MRYRSEEAVPSPSFFSGIRPGHGGIQPSPGVPPGAFGFAQRDAQALGRLLDCQPGEEPQLHQLGLDGVVRRKLLQGLVLRSAVALSSQELRAGWSLMDEYFASSLTRISARR